MSNVKKLTNKEREIILKDAVKEAIKTGDIRAVAENKKLKVATINTAIKKHKEELLGTTAANVAQADIVTKYKKILKDQWDLYEKVKQEKDVKPERVQKMGKEVLNAMKIINEMYSTFGLTPDVSSIKGGITANLTNVHIEGYQPELLYADAVKANQSQMGNKAVDISALIGKKVTRPEDLKHKRLIERDEEEDIEVDYSINEPK